MHKIYSRPRLKIPKVVIHMKNNKERSGKRAKILIIVVIAFMTLAFIISAVTPIFDTLCKNEAISMATIIANNKATEVMAKHTYDELFSIEKDESGNIKMIKNISINLLIPFENHPFKKRNGIEHQELTESIKENGLLEPIIVRSFPAGKYEIISGHRRVEACKELGITSVPAIIEELTKDEAIVQMVWYFSQVSCL